MAPRTAKQSLVWGGVLILVGVLLLVETVTDLSPWIWFVVLAAGGLAALGVYLADRSDWAMLITAYVLLAIALLVALIALNVLGDEAIGAYILMIIALAFLGVYLRNRALWWALIPAYVLLVLAVMIGLIGLGVLDDLLIPAYILLAIALPFFVVYARDRSLWWALIPGGILAVIGLSFLAAEAAFAYIVAAVLILVGAWILVRVFTRGEPSLSETISPPEPETGAQEWLEEE